MKKFILTLAMLGAVSLVASTASANVGAGKAFDLHYNSSSTCTSCHTGAPGTLLTLGIDWKANGGTSQSGPTTQAQWDALDAKYATTYGGVNPNWTLASSTPVREQATVTGCVTNNIQIPFLLFLGLMASLLLFGKKSIVLSKVE